MLDSFFAFGSHEIAVVVAALLELQRGATRPKDESAVRMLAHLVGAGRRGVSQRETARAIGMSEAAMSRLADQLEADGLVARQGHPNDRRVKMLHLTAAGEGQLKLCAHGTCDRTAVALTAFSAAERELLLQLLNRLASCGSAPRPCVGCRVGGC